MKKYNILILLMVGLFVVSPLFAAENMSSTSASNSALSSSSLQVFHANDMIGKTVKNKLGENLGKVEDLIISKDGRADFVVLSRGGTLGIGANYVPVPFQTFMSNSNLANINTDNDLIAGLDKAKLDAATSFSDKNWEMSNKSMQDKICNYYGSGACPFRG